MELSGCWRKHCSCLALGLLGTDPEVRYSLKITLLCLDVWGSAAGLPAAAATESNVFRRKLLGQGFVLSVLLQIVLLE